MNKTKDTGYLFAKMSSAGDENRNGHIIITEKNDSSKSPMQPTRTFHFEDNGKSGEKQTFRKWILNNAMLLVTLCGVSVGVVTGEIASKFLQVSREIEKIFHPIEVSACDTINASSSQRRL